MNVEDLSSTLQERIQTVSSADTYEYLKNFVGEALNDATTQEEFEYMIANSLEDLAEQVRKVRRIFRGK
jgi:guanylate kinase